MRSCSSGPSRVGLGAGVPEGAHGLRGWHQHRFPWVAAHRGFRFAGGEHRRPFPVAAVRDCSVPRSSARLPAPRPTAGCELAARGCSGTGASRLLCGCVGMGTAAAERRASPEGWLPAVRCRPPRSWGPHPSAGPGRCLDSPGPPALLQMRAPESLGSSSGPPRLWGLSGHWSQSGAEERQRRYADGPEPRRASAWTAHPARRHRARRPGPE